MVLQLFALRDAQFGGDVAGGDLRCQLPEWIALLVVVPAGPDLAPVAIMPISA
jgi:hypothetical protein